MDRRSLFDTTLARLIRGGAIGSGSRDSDAPPADAGPCDSFALALRSLESESTARVHVSRILQTLGVAKRTAVAAVLDAETSDHGALPALTARQRDVVALITTGATNRVIAQELGIGVTTVEKHVSAIFARWAFASRAEVVHLTLGGTRTEP